MGYNVFFDVITRKAELRSKISKKMSRQAMLQKRAKGKIQYSFRKAII